MQTGMAFAQVDRFNEIEVIEQGGVLFKQHCASCHGGNAEGTVTNWQEPDDDGNFPPPPLNGTAHTWHHPIHALGRVIREGTTGIGGSMPAWKEVLSEDDIFAIIMYISSLWPDEIYQAWMQRNQQQ